MTIIKTEVKRLEASLHKDLIPRIKEYSIYFFGVKIYTYVEKDR